MIDSSSLQQAPTPDKPILIGFMIDVSLSMASNIRNSSGSLQKRLDSFRDALDEFVNRGRMLCRDEANQQIVPLFKVFAYGFGFGNAVTMLLGSKGPKVRDLLNGVNMQGSTVTIDQLFENWDVYQSHIKSLVPQMFGHTPMLEAFKQVQQRFTEERDKASFTNPPILFVLSDGEPTDGASNEVLHVAQGLQESGVFIVSCYVTDQNIANTKKLYGTNQVDWPEAAKLAFAYASILPEGSSFDLYFRELGWKAEKKARMFAQVNQSELLKEFLEVVLSPLQLLPHSPQLQYLKGPKVLQESKHSKEKIRVFVSYSHQDRKYLENDSLLGYLKGLEREGFEFWHDQDISTGAIWNEEIQGQMASADITLVLVSQALLNSKYCQEKEIASFIEERKNRGLIIFPVILSACNWKGYDWLSSTQFLPRDGKNIESSFRDRGKRRELYLQIYNELRKIGKRI
jgi:TIR domain